MGTINWTGNAAAVRQIDTITVADVWTANDTVTLTINGKDLVVTIGSMTTTAQVAQAIRDAWNATSRLDTEGATDASSNFGGQEFGEFAEATASIDDDATSVVVITANRAGYPFTLSVTEATAGTGTATETTTQAATGPHHWNNGDNWSSGSAPANDDIVVFKDNDVPCLFGLPNASLEVTIQQWQSYTGSIGLPPINRWNQSKPYTEYRQRYLRLDDAGTGTDITHRFGLGQEGSGSPLINLKHLTIKCSPIVYNTGTPQIPGVKALNICCTATTSTLSILNGHVDWGTQDSGTSAFTTIKQTNGTSRGINGVNAAANTTTMSGGTMTIGGSATLGTVSVYGGILRMEDQTGAITSIFIYDSGTVDYASTATIGTELVILGGTFDARANVGPFTISAGGAVYKGGRFLDPYRRMSSSSNLVLYFDPSPDLQFGASPSSAITIDT